MEYDAFEKIVDEYKKKYPILFALEQDEIPSREQVDAFEIKQNIVLSEKYRNFLLQFGGGYFGYANIYSLDSRSDFYLLRHNKLPIEHVLYILQTMDVETAIFYKSKTKYVWSHCSILSMIQVQFTIQNTQIFWNI